MSSKEPFFILGSVRSGTTVLRDVLRRHPNLAAPEETHFFRWAEPYGTGPYENKYLHKALFENHRRLDGVKDFDFFYTLQNARHRRDLMDNYARIFLEGRQQESRRWFDKTPQNVYGVMLISANYPEARFVHIHRHPYNVVASLRRGGMLRRQGIRGAINYWLESMLILSEYRKGFPDRILELSYETLGREPLETVNHLLGFIGEPHFTALPEDIEISEEQNRYPEILSEEELAYIRECCGDMMQVYGYAD